MTTHRTDVRVLFEAPTDPVTAPLASKVEERFLPREQWSLAAVADHHLDLDPPADLDVRSTGRPAGLVPSAYIDYDAIDTLFRFIGHPVERRA